MRGVSWSVHGATLATLVWKAMFHGSAMWRTVQDWMLQCTDLGRQVREGISGCKGVQT